MTILTEIWQYSHMDTIHSIFPKNFPPLLQEIPDKPRKLYIRGQYPDTEKNKFLTVVGSRKCSNYGKDILQSLIQGLKGYPIVIVSGLAFGLDAYAHFTALQTNLTTIAVPGSGISDQALYPATHKRLAHTILNAQGCVLSEFDPHFKATRWSFPRRNRVMAGLSHAVLVIEGAHKSGTLITAQCALDYNRDVFTVPGSIFSKNTQGPHQLIKNGAVPITSSEDLLQALGFTNPETDRTTNILRALSQEEQRVVSILSEPLTKDELIRSLKLPVAKAHILLSSLEIKGIIIEQYGKIRLKQ